MTYQGKPRIPSRLERFDTWLERFYPIIVIACALLAFGVRVYHLEARPLHHDEGINGWFIERLVEHNDYTYSPEHYHGPTFFYLGKIFSTFFGLSTFSIRLIAVVFGTLLCLVPFMLRRHLSNLSQTAVSVGLALGPAALFFSRYAIHEVILVFLTALLLASLYCYLTEGDGMFVVVAGFALASACATKETIVVALAALGVGFFSAFTFSSEWTWTMLQQRLKSWWVAGMALAYAAGLFVWFRPKEVIAYFQSYLFYRKLEASAHQKPWDSHLKILFFYETLWLFLGVWATVVALRRRRPLDLIFLGWAWVSLFAYSAISYKTPWLILNLTVPLTFFAATLIDDLVERPRLSKASLGLLAVAALLSVQLVATSLKLSFKDFAEGNDSFHDFRAGKNPYCYAHNVPSAQVLNQRIIELLEQDPKLKVDVVSPEYWPYPFTLRQVKERMLYWGKMIPNLEGGMVLARVDQEPEIRLRLGPHYHSEIYDVRSGLKLEIFYPENLK